MPDRRNFHKGNEVGNVLIGIENELHTIGASYSDDEDESYEDDDGNPIETDGYKAWKKVKSALRRNRKFMVTTDGSLLYNDCEIITEPQPYNARTLTNISKTFHNLNKKKLVEYLAIDDPDNPGGDISYGLHINISGYQLEVGHRAQEFLVANQDQFEAIAGREDGYNDYFRYRVSGVGEKYCCVHLRTNGVFEFRIFAASTDPKVLKYRMQVTHAVCEFCKAHENKEARTWENFVGYVHNNRKKYPELKSFIRTIK